MSDTAPPSTAVPATDTRSLALIVYGLYIGAVVTCGIAGVVGVVLAYIKRDEARGTVWHSHFENAIHAFWAWFMMMVIGILTSWFLVGFFIMGAAFLYFLYRTIKGLVAAIESRPYV
jgi:uncharacterized membrane protein